MVGEVRNEDDVQRAVDAAVERFGGIDVVVNNASAIATDPTERLSTKKFDLMIDVDVRGTFLLTRAALPHLRQSANAHVITLAPPLNTSPHWLGAHPSYTLSKYGMTLLSLGWAAEFADAAAAILTMPAATANGRCFIDADVLTASGVTDLSGYSGGDDTKWDIFVDAPELDAPELDAPEPASVP